MTVNPANDLKVLDLVEKYLQSNNVLNNVEDFQIFNFVINAVQCLGCFHEVFIFLIHLQYFLDSIFDIRWEVVLNP